MKHTWRLMWCIIFLIFSVRLVCDSFWQFAYLLCQYELNVRYIWAVKWILITLCLVSVTEFRSCMSVLLIFFCCQKIFFSLCKCTWLDWIENERAKKKTAANKRQTYPSMSFSRIGEWRSQFSRKWRELKILTLNFTTNSLVLFSSINRHTSLHNIYIYK